MSSRFTLIGRRSLRFNDNLSLSVKNNRSLKCWYQNFQQTCLPYFNAQSFKGFLKQHAKANLYNLTYITGDIPSGISPCVGCL